MKLYMTVKSLLQWASIYLSRGEQSCWWPGTDSKPARLLGDPLSSCRAADVKVRRHLSLTVLDFIYPLCPVLGGIKGVHEDNLIFLELEISFFLLPEPWSTVPSG